MVGALYFPNIDNIKQYIMIYFKKFILSEIDQILTVL